MLNYFIRRGTYHHYSPARAGSRAAAGALSAMLASFDGLLVLGLVSGVAYSLERGAVQGMLMAPFVFVFGLIFVPVPAVAGALLGALRSHHAGWVLGPAIALGFAYPFTQVPRNDDRFFVLLAVGFGLTIAHYYTQHYRRFTAPVPMPTAVAEHV